MFDFLSMFDNYEERKIANYDKGGLFIDTCAVTDSLQPYETAVSHKKYNNGKLVVVEMYDSKKAAQEGHKRWINKMTSKNKPKLLKDVSTSTIARMCNAFK